jgi:hypothetical protein
MYPARSLAHEYGHAWSNYWLCRAQQGDWSAYFDFRGLSEEPRLDSSYPTWSRGEMIADDYRATFGAPSAMSDETELTNTNLPKATGLRDFFLNVWARR